jgi:hypothetical protein
LARRWAGYPGNGLVGDELLEVDRLAILFGFDVEADRLAAASEPQSGKETVITKGSEKALRDHQTYGAAGCGVSTASS